MAETVASDDKRFYAENGSVGDNITATCYGELGDIHLSIEEPWAGDTETGFGRNCGFTLPKDQAVALANWILKACSTTAQKG